MLEVKIGTDGIVSHTSINLGNRWENKDEKIHFDIPSTFDSYNKYLYAAMMKNGVATNAVVLPIASDNTFYVTSKLTHLAGRWNMYVICRENTMDLNADKIDLTAQPGEHVFISNGFIGLVNNNYIDKQELDNQKLDTNLQIVYDELKALYNVLLDKINNDSNEKVITSYNDLTDKPKINGFELNGNLVLDDILNAVTIHKLNAKSFSGLYKVLKNQGLELDEEDVSTFLFVLTNNEIETMFDNKFVELNTFKIYKAEYNPFTNMAIVSCDDFTMDVKSEGIVRYESLVKDNSDEEVDLSTKLDVYQGIENAGRILSIGDDGNVTLVNASTVIEVDETDLDSLLEEVYSNG